MWKAFTVNHKAQETAKQGLGRAGKEGQDSSIDGCALCGDRIDKEEVDLKSDHQEQNREYISQPEHFSRYDQAAKVILTVW